MSFWTTSFGVDRSGGAMAKEHRTIGVRCAPNPQQEKKSPPKLTIYQHVSTRKPSDRHRATWAAAPTPIEAARNRPTLPQPICQQSSECSARKGMARRSHIHAQSLEASNIRCRKVIQAELQI
jgi:hypothetical protein